MEVIQRNRRILAAMTVLAIVAALFIVLRLFKPSADGQLSFRLFGNNEVITSQKNMIAVGRKGSADLKSEKMITDWNNPDVADKITGDFPLNKAVRLGLKERVNTLIANGADINAGDKTGRTPLHYAVEYFHRDMMRLLVENGDDVNARDSHGYTPLHYAVIDPGLKDMAEYLRKNGAQE